MSKKTDTEELIVDDTQDDPKKSDFVKIGSDVATSLNIKIAFFLFIIGMVIFSDVFIDGVLSKMPDTVQGEITTTKGTMLQLLIFVLLYIVVDLVVQRKWL